LSYFITFRRLEDRHHETVTSSGRDIIHAIQKIVEQYKLTIDQIVAAREC
jgi:hypothetical protein